MLSPTFNLSSLKLTSTFRAAAKCEILVYLCDSYASANSTWRHQIVKWCFLRLEFVTKRQIFERSKENQACHTENSTYSYHNLAKCLAKWSPDSLVLLATEVSKMCDADRWDADDGKMPKNTDCADCWLPNARRRSYSEQRMFILIRHCTLQNPDFDSYFEQRMFILFQSLNHCTKYWLWLM